MMIPKNESHRAQDETKTSEFDTVKNIICDKSSRNKMSNRDMNHSANSLVITANPRDKGALDFEVEIEENRQIKHKQSALFVMRKAQEEFDPAEDDNYTDDTFNTAELDLTLNFTGLCWQQKITKICAVIFITLEIPSSSVLAKIVSVAINLIIVTAVMSYILSTELTFRVIPDTCLSPACDHDPMYCPDTTICADETAAHFDLVDQICTYLFTVEYGLRLLTCFAVTPRVAGIIPPEWEVIHRFNHREAVQPSYSICWTLTKFVSKFKNIIDLASILPMYVGFILSSGQQTGFVRVLRLLRLVRVLRLLKLLSFMKNVDVARELISETLRQSALILSVFMFFVTIIIILFGCIIYLCEGGTFTVNSDYPHGAYLRLDQAGNGLQISPFDSIPTGMYWVISTASGAGDLSATTIAGRAVACVLEIIGVLGLALPVGVIGSELDRAYTKHFVRLMKISEDRQARLIQDAIDSAVVVVKKKPLPLDIPSHTAYEGLNLRDDLNTYGDKERAFNAGDVFAAAVARFSSNATAIGSRKLSIASLAPRPSMCDSDRRYDEAGSERDRIKSRRGSMGCDRLSTRDINFDVKSRNSVCSNSNNYSDSCKDSHDGMKYMGMMRSNSTFPFPFHTPASPLSPLENIQLLIIGAKESVFRAEEHLRLLERLEVSLQYPDDDDTTQTQEDTQT